MSSKPSQQSENVSPAGAVEIRSIILSPIILNSGDLLNVSITLFNGIPETLATQGPDPGFVYDEGDTFRSRGFTETRDSFRVGVDFDERAGIDHPYRWGLGTPLAPGQTATITGAIRLKTARSAQYWAGLVREQVAWLQDKQGAQTITVTAPSPVQITNVTFTPTTLSAGGLLNVSITVRNDSTETLQTQGPNSGFVYEEWDTFRSRGFTETRGAFRVGIDFDGRSGIDHPYRWGLGAPLAPGQTATIIGAIRLKTARAVKYWAGLVREQVAWLQDGKGTQTITVNTGAVHITNATFTPTTVSAGGLLKVTITVRNDSGETLPTQGPDPGFVYDEGDTFRSRGFTETGDSFRVGVDFDGRTGVDHPYRWGLGAPFAPGQTATITGAIRLQTPRAINYWCGLVREKSAWLDDRQGTQVITVTPAPTCSFGVTPSSILTGESATLQWSATGARTVSLDGETVLPIGSRVVAPTQTTTYNLRVVFLDGSTKDASATLTVEQLNLIQYVDPFIGTDYSDPPNSEPGSDYPGAVVPFGMVQFSPDTPAPAPASYRYRDTKIEEFSVTHFNGAGCSNNEDIGILPIIGALGNSPGTHWTSYSSDFTKANESASPGYYKTRLDRYGITAELTATIRTGMARFTCPATTQATVLINTSRNATSNRSGSININGNRITGDFTGGGFCRSTKTFKIYFAIEFDRMPSSHGTWFGFSITPGSNQSGGIDSGGYVTFDTTTDSVVQMKIGLSYVSIANAQLNLATENPGWDFSMAQSNARTAWNNILKRVQVSGGAPEDLKKFYTALYHVFQSPNVASDVNAQYMGFDSAAHTASGMIVYQNYSGWDIYRAWAALMAMLAPDEMTDIVKSMILDGQQGGALPKWSQQNQEHFIMTGDPGPIIVSSAYAFGVRNFDTAAALALMNKSGSVVGTTIQGERIRGDLGDYLNLRYVPGNASVSLEYSAADFAIAQFAKALGDTAKYNYFMSHAQWWRNVFNPGSGYIHPRNRDGSWLAPFDPKSNTGFTEGNAAQYTWMIPYNYAELINLMGGKANAIQRLDYYFTQVKGGYSQPYFHIANEPGHNQPWVYNYAGAPWGAQAVVRRIMTETFTTGMGGVPGNDDLGATSAWYVWAALGMFPVTPGADTLALHGPLFTSATIKLAGDKVLQINGAGAGNGAPYIQGLVVNGTPTTRTWLPFSGIANGATLDFTMGSSPNKNWGIKPEDAPPSFDDGS